MLLPWVTDVAWARLVSALDLEGSLRWVDLDLEVDGSVERREVRRLPNVEGEVARRLRSVG